MERRLPFIFLAVIAIALCVAVSVVFAQPPSANPGSAAPSTAGALSMLVVTDIVLRLATLLVLAGGLIGTFAVLVSLRAAAYGQVYGRFQSLLLKLAEHPQLFDRLKKDEYSDAEDDPAHPHAVTLPHRFIANAMVNMYEEAFLLHDAKVLAFIRTVPEEYWQSMLGSMRAAFQLRYVRTHWEKRQAVFSESFNRFVREQIIGYKGVNPAPDVA